MRYRGDRQAVAAKAYKHMYGEGGMATNPEAQRLRRILKQHHKELNLTFLKIDNMLVGISKHCRNYGEKLSTVDNAIEERFE